MFIQAHSALGLSECLWPAGRRCQSAMSPRRRLTFPAGQRSVLVREPGPRTNTDRDVIRTTAGLLMRTLDRIGTRYSRLQRGFCAGGDIRAVRESAHGIPMLAATLWREGYELDALIAHYLRPVAVVMDGITMGGGVGLGAHAGPSWRRKSP